QAEAGIRDWSVTGVQTYALPICDPAYLRLRQELAAGAVPFTCQGSENGLAIEGGQTIAYELATQLAGTAMDHMVIQVGGGALAKIGRASCRERSEVRGAEG